MAGRQITIEFLGKDKSLGSTADGIGGKTSKLGGQLAKFGIMAAAAVASAAAATAVGLFKIGASFDDAYDNIRIKTGATGEALESLKDDVRALAKQVPSSLDDISTAITGVTQRLDLTGKPLRDVATQMLNLSRLTGTDLTTNIESITRLFGDWDVKTNKMTGTMDKLFRASQATGTPIDQLAESMTKFGAPMRQLGFDFDTTAALLGKFEEEGVNSNLVMGAMRIALGKMARDGEPAQRTLRRVTEEIKGAGSASEANKIALELFGAKAGPDMAAAIREGRFAVDDLVKTISKGGETVKKASDDTADFGEKWQIFKNRVMVGLEPLATRVFDAMGTGMDKVAEAAREMAPKLAELKPHIEAIRDWIENKLVPAARKFYEWFVDKIVPGLKRTLMPVLESLRDGFKDLSDAVKRNEPELRDLGDVLKKVAEIIYTKIGPALGQFAGRNLKILFKMIGWVIDATAWWIRSMQNAKRGLDKIIWVVENFGIVLDQVKGAVGRMASAVAAKVGEVVATVGRMPGRIRAAIGNLGRLLYNAGAQVVAGLMAGIASMMGRLGAMLDRVTSMIPDRIKGGLEINSPSRVLTEVGVNIMQGLVKGIESKKTALKTVLDRVTDFVKAQSDKLKGLISDRNSFAAGFRSFSSSVFGADMTDPETGASTASVSSILAFQREQKAKAKKLRADVAKLTKMGLSKDLINQLASEGEAGIAQISALASGSSADIAELNALNASTASNLNAAGMNAGNAIFGDRISDSRETLQEAKALRRVLDRLDKNISDDKEIVVQLDGQTLLTWLRKKRRKSGAALGI